MNEQLLKTSGADVSSSRKKTQKNLGGGGAGWRPPPLVLPRVEIKYEKNKGCEQKNGQFFTGQFFGGGNKMVSMGLTDRRRTATNLGDSRKN